MATATFTGTGNWDDATGKWAGGGGTAGQPTVADAAVLAAGSVCTLNIATAVCDSLTSSSSGQLAVDGTVDTKLIVDKGIAFSGSTSYLNLDMSAAPTKKCEIYWNNDNIATSGANSNLAITGKFNLKGAQKTTWTTATDALVGGTTLSVHVTDATGWREGDKLVFATTQAYDGTVISTTAVSWAANVLTVTNSGTNASLEVGDHVIFAGLTATNSPTTMLNVDMVVSSITSTTEFKCSFATNPGVITDQVGTATKMPRTDAVTIAVGGLTFDSGTTGPATITWSDGKGAGGSVAHNHADNCLVANFTRNLILGPAVINGVAPVILTTGANANNGVINDVEFSNSNPTSDFGADGVIVVSSTNSAIAGINRCAFYNFRRKAISWVGALNSISRSDNVYYTEKTFSYVNAMSTTKGPLGNETNMVVLRCETGPQFLAPGITLFDPMISGLWGGASSGAGQLDINNPGGPMIASYGDATLDGGGVWSCRYAAAATQTAGGRVTYKGTWIGNGFSGSDYSGAGNGWIFSAAGPTDVVFDSCPEDLTGTTARIVSSSSGNTSEVAFYNRDNDPLNQDIYRPKASIASPTFVRDGAEMSNANASMRIDTLGTFEIYRDFPILVKGGAATTLFVLCKKNADYGSSTRPTAQLTGLGTSLAAVTCPDNTDWNVLDLSYASGAAPSSDGVLTLRLTAQSAASTGKAYFSGIPITPFVTRARHYGWVVNETSPTQIADPAIDPGISEATAGGYTGITITWGATSSISTGADQTFKKLVHYTAATMDTNVSSALPITWAGAYDSPAIFAQGDINISGDTVNGSGSIDMGSNTLTATVPFSYTFTGGTFSQAATSPSFTGGTLTIPTAITTGGDFSMTNATIEFGAASALWDFGDVAFSSTITLATTAGQAVTVAMPIGTTINNTEPGNITVTVPVVTADISITSMPNDAAGNTRLQIINKTALSASAWAANTVYATGALVKRSTGIGSESTAGLYFRATSGGTSHLTTEPTWNTTPGGTTTDNGVTWTTYKVLYYDTDPAATSLADTYVDGEEFLAGETAEIRFAEMNGATSFKTYSTEVAIATTGFSALVAEEADSVFATFAIDGSTLEATFSPNFTSDYIVLDSNTDFSGKGAFAYYCYTLTTSQGMYEFWGGITALDEGNIRINTSVLNLYFDESAGFVKQTDDVRIFRDDGLRPALDPTSGGEGIEINWRTPVSVVTTGGSALTPSESAYLLALPSASTTASSVLSAAQTTPIHSDVRKVVGITVDGTGTDIDPWGPA